MNGASSVRPADVLTKRDLDAFEQRMNLRFDALGQRFQGFEHKITAASRGESLAGAMGDLTDLIRGRTRSLITINVVTVVSSTALLFAIGKLA